MPRKIGYNVVGATGEAEGYSAKNLEHQNPTVPGWQTPRFCVYPQELIIRLNEPCQVKKLQILSHQYMIGSKIEFFIGSNASPENFKRLGYIYLSNNEKTGFKSRELKSVHIDSDGQYIRLVIHRNHLNKFNLYNQVGLMAFNAIGDPINSLHRPPKQLDDEALNTARYLEDSFTKPDFISPMDDLAFDMYQDPEVAGIIRRLDIKKKEAVIAENFDMAKRMKQAIADLQKVGEKLARYELDKRRAIEHEDYDLAKSKKTQMDEYRLKVYQQLQKHNLLSDAGISPHLPEKDGVSPLRKVENPPESPRKPHVESRSPSHHQSPELRRSLSPVVSTHVEQEEAETSLHSILEQRNSPTYPPSPPEEHLQYEEEQSFLAYDDKVIPALSKHKDPDPFLEEVASPPPVGSPEQPQSAVGEPEPMSEKSIREARSVIDVFDVPLVSGAYSKMWSFREDALLAVYKLLSNVPSNTPKDELRSHVRAAVFLVKRAIKDKVHAVYNASLRLLEMILVEFIPQHKLGKSETTHAVSHTLPGLLQKTGETAARSRTSALDFVVRMSEFTTVHHLHLVPQHAVPPFKRDTANRLALSRVELLKRLLDKYGLEPPALTVDTVMKFAVAALEHASGAVREETTKIIFQIYKMAGAPVKAYLPNDDHMTRKNPLFRNLFDGFDKIDGKPTQTQLKAQLQAEERQKRQEIEELQAQVDHLRSVNKANEAHAAPHHDNKQQKKTKKTINKSQVYSEDDATPNKSTNPPVNDESFLDKMCIFCGERDDSFTEEGLDLHYWKHCPMLKRCEHCKQVVEIAGYSEHLLAECESKENFGKCPRCTEAIAKSELQKHVADKRCVVLKPSTQDHCPLCHRSIPQGEESWKSHLMGSKRDACNDNPRRLPSINRLRAKAEQQKHAGAPSKGKRAVPVRSPRK